MLVRGVLDFPLKSLKYPKQKNRLVVRDIEKPVVKCVRIAGGGMPERRHAAIREELGSH